LLGVGLLLERDISIGILPGIDLFHTSEQLLEKVKKVKTDIEQFPHLSRVDVFMPNDRIRQGSALPAGKYYSE
jgi:hypothetical protein